MPATTEVRAVVVHFGPPERTRRCLDSVRAALPDAHLVVVDNGPGRSSFPVADEVRHQDRNRGFAGGAAAGTNDAGGIVVLCNNDVVVGDVAGLLAAFDDPRVGAACPTVVFAEPLSLIEWASDGPVALRTVTVAGTETAIRLCATPGRAAVRAAPGAPVSAVFRATTGDVRVRLDGGPWHAIAVDDERAAPLGDARPRRLVNSTGVALDRLGRGYDVDELGAMPGPPPGGPVSRPLWSGSTVALRAEAVLAAGGFDPAWFLYAEDVDLGWRMASLGWRTVWVPEAVVEHEHMATSGAEPGLHRRMAMRNHLLTVGANAPAGDALRAVTRTVAGTVAWRAREVASREAGAASRLGGDLRAMAAALARIPAARRRHQGVRRVPIAALALHPNGSIDRAAPGQDVARR